MKKKKLHLHRETLRHLSDKQASQIAAGESHTTIFPTETCIYCSFLCSVDINYPCFIVEQD